MFEIKVELNFQIIENQNITLFISFGYVLRSKKTDTNNCQPSTDNQITIQSRKTTVR